VSMLSKLEEAIKELERRKDELLGKIQEAGWKDDRGGDVEYRETPELKDFREFTYPPEIKVLPPEIKILYQQWYSAARTIVAENHAGRLVELEELYQKDGCHCISLFLKESYIDRDDQFKLMDYINLQFGILAGVLEHLKFSMYDIELNVYSVLMRNEIEAAKYLLKNGFLRSAGVLAGVVLERHLKNLLRKHDPPIQYSGRATLGRLNNLCEGKVYDTAEASRVEVLNQLRIKCVHDKEREPDSEDVKELIEGVSKMIKKHLVPAS